MYYDINFVRCGMNQISSCTPQKKWGLQACGLRPCLFNLFINNTVECTDMEDTFPVISEWSIPELFAHDRLQHLLHVLDYKKTELVNKYFTQWNLRCNFNKYKTMVFKNEGKLKTT